MHPPARFLCVNDPLRLVFMTTQTSAMDSAFKSVHHDKYPFIDPSGAALKDSARGRTVLVTGASRGIGKVSITGV